MNQKKAKIAYFSAEIGMSADLPTYSGGLGVLAGDHIKASTDANLPIVAISLLYKEGYFKQQLEVYGRQGKACKICSSTLKNVTIGQRSSVYCPECQK